MGVTEIKDFHVLEVELPNSKSPHYIYFKKHSVKGSKDSDANRSIFIFNLPINTTTSTIKKYLLSVAIGATLETFTPSILTDYPEDIWIDFTKLTSDLEIQKNDDGDIKLHLYIDQSLSQGGSVKLPKNCGIITFIDKPSLQLAFSSLKKLSSNGESSKWPIDAQTFGGSAFFHANLRSQVLDNEWLSEFVSQSLVNFDEAEQKSIQDLQNQAQLVDDDGFTLVVGSHRKTKAAILGKQKLAATVEVKKAENKLKKKEKEDFYRFQLRQKKKDEMNDLLRKFKIDQEKVRLMKEKKRFRPY